MNILVVDKYEIGVLLLFLGQVFKINISLVVWKHARITVIYIRPSLLRWIVNPSLASTITYICSRRPNNYFYAFFRKLPKEEIAFFASPVFDGDKSITLSYIFL